MKSCIISQPAFEPSSTIIILIACKECLYIGASYHKFTAFIAADGGLIGSIYAQFCNHRTSVLCPFTTCVDECICNAQPAPIREDIHTPNTRAMPASLESRLCGCQSFQPGRHCGLPDKGWHVPQSRSTFSIIIILINVSLVIGRKCFRMIVKCL